MKIGKVFLLFIVMATILMVCNTLPLFSQEQKTLKEQDLTKWLSKTINWLEEKREGRDSYKRARSTAYNALRMIGLWNSDRSGRAKITGTVNAYRELPQEGLTLVVMTAPKTKTELVFATSINNPDVKEIKKGYLVDFYVVYVYEQTPQGLGIFGFIEYCDILDKPDETQWIYNGVTYTKSPLQEALRISRNEGGSGKIYNFWTSNINFALSAGFFILKTGTAELALVEYYGDDLETSRGNGGVLYTIDCRKEIPKVTAVRFMPFFD